GATYTIINPTARLQTGQFCWTPGPGTASPLPYTFTVTARDNACPLNAVSVRAFRVRVKPRAETDRLIDTLDCGLYALESDPIDGFQGTPSYQWTLLDSNRNLIFDKKVAYFKSTGNFLSRSQFDSIQFRRGGMYIIQHDINNLPINCPSTFYDTLIVPPLLEVDLSLGKDTFACAGTTLTFKPSILNSTDPIEYQWSTMGVTNDGDFIDNVTSNASDNKDTFLLSVQNVVYDTAVSVLIKDASGCTAEDTVQVFLKANPLAILPPDVRICSYDSFNLVPNLDLAYWVDPIIGDTLVQGDTLEKEWFYNGEWIPFSIADSVTIDDEGAYVIRVRDSLNCQDTDTFFLHVNDTVTALAGNDQTLCFNDLYEIKAGGLDTVGTGKSGLYRWWNITPSTTPSSIGFNDTYVRTAGFDSTYRLELFVTEGGIECYDDDTMSVAVNALPIIDLSAIGDLCCDYGDVSLNFSIKTPSGIPSTGFWACDQYPNLVENNIFYTDSACGLIQSPSKNLQTYVQYTYTDPATLCINSDSVFVQVNSLPTLILNEKDYCQDYGSVRLDDEVVISPANTSLGSPSWRCLDSNSITNNFFADMLENRGSQFAPDYWLNIDELNYEIQNPDKDTIVLEFNYTNEKGCKSSDTVSIRIWRVPKIEFSRNRDLCFDEGDIKLDSLTGLNLAGGTWTCYDSTGFESCANMSSIVGDTINTTQTIDDDLAHTWMMRYFHDATGCPAVNYIPVTINPLPVINIDVLTPNQFCENNAAVNLNATPAGGTWTSSDPTAIVGSTFSPPAASVYDVFSQIYYDYTSTLTGCKNRDSIQARVDKQPSINPINDTTFCRDEGQTSISLNYNLTGENFSGLSWVAPAASFPSNVRATLSPYSDVNDEVLTLQLQNAKADTFRIVTFAFPDASSKCKTVDSYFDVIVNPIPDVSITNSNPADCNPVTTDFDIVFSNGVDPTTSQYAWILGEGSTATTQATAATYSTDGTTNVEVNVRSDKGCDTTIFTSVDVYPIPTADFLPNPNNYTTAALPRFIFNNQSTTKDQILNSVIVDNEWDFGDLGSTDDTSTLESPSHFYPTDTATYNVTLTVRTNHGCE
ncbi:MAG: PKD domain-containing protein, partial [Bacteroidia bacterium]